MSEYDSPAIRSTTPVLSVLNPDNGPIDAQLVDWLEERYGTLRQLLARSARDLVTIGHMLCEVKSEVAPQEFIAFIGVLGLSKATVYRWMAAAEVATGCSHVENLEPSALYALSAKSTPEGVRQEFLQRADAGHQVTHQEVQMTLRQHRPVNLQARPNRVEQLVDGMVDADEAGVGRDWRGRDVRAELLRHEIMRFAEGSRPDVAATVLAWGHACVKAAQPFVLGADDQ
jgi:hypothetical protein